MPSVRTQFSVGLFVIIGMAVVVIFILWLGMVQYFQEGRKYVAFFDESVQGLQKDSSVKYRGVDIGRVDDIRVAPDSRLVQIVLNLREPLQDKDTMVAQIKAVGITGIMFVELERIPPGETVSLPKLDFEPSHPVIATKPSEMQQLFTDLYAIMNEIKQVDFKRIANNVSTTLDNVNQTLTDAQVQKISSKIQKTLAAAEELIAPEKWQPIRENIRQASTSMNQLINKTDQSVVQVSETLATHNKEIAAAIDEFQTAVNNASTMLAAGNALINTTNRQVTQFHQQLNISLRHLESVSNNLNRLINDLINQPSRLIFSPPPPPAKALDGQGKSP